MTNRVVHPRLRPHPHGPTSADRNEGLPAGILRRYSLYFVPGRCNTGVVIANEKIFKRVLLRCSLASASPESGICKVHLYAGVVIDKLCVSSLPTDEVSREKKKGVGLLVGLGSLVSRYFPANWQPVQPLAAKDPRNARSRP